MKERLKTKRLGEWHNLGKKEERSSAPASVIRRARVLISGHAASCGRYPEDGGKGEELVWSRVSALHCCRSMLGRY